MKKILLSTTALSFALTASALAADLPSRKAAIVEPPPPATWTGCYAGLNAGAGFDAGSNLSGYYVTGDPAEPPPADAGSATFTAQSSNLGGFVGGGQVGCNYQFSAGFGSWVVGVETDFQGSTLTGGNFLTTGIITYVNADPGGTFSGVDTRQRLNWFGTVRARLGFLALPNLLVYGTGGFAYGGLSHKFRKLDIIGDPDDIGGIYSVTAWNSTLTGYTAGGGVEWLFAPGWSAKLEYLYTDFGSTTLRDGGLGRDVLDENIWVSVGQHQFATRFHTVRAGVNYHFNWAAPAPVFAKY